MNPGIENLKLQFSKNNSDRLKGIKTHNSQKIINLTNGIVFESCREACIYLGLNPSSSSHLKKCALEGKQFHNFYWKIEGVEVDLKKKEGKGTTDP